jgi:hypothetical protein
MKRVIIGLVIALASTQTANADVYVKVDAQGNAVSGPIMCDAITCSAGSEFSRLTLGTGESYALQGNSSSGIGNNTPGATVKVDLETNDWTVTRSTTVNLPEPIKTGNTEITAITTQTTERFNPVQTVNPAPVVQVPTLDTATATTVIAATDTPTAISILDEELDLTWGWDKILAWIVAWFDSIWIRL